MDLTSLRSKYGNQGVDPVSQRGRPGLSPLEIAKKDGLRANLGAWLKSLRLTRDIEKVSNMLDAIGEIDIERALQAERSKKSTPNGRVAMSLAVAYGVSPYEVASRILAIDDPALLACLLTRKVVSPKVAKAILEKTGEPS